MRDDVRARVSNDLQGEILAAAESDVRVLVSGPNHADKQFVARLLHRQSRRYLEPFIVVDAENIGVVCTSRSREADRLIDECLTRAVCGTLLIHRSDRNPVVTEKILLRVIDMPDEKRVRLISAADTDVFDRVRVGTFPAALFYRLNLVHLVLAPTSGA